MDEYVRIYIVPTALGYVADSVSVFDTCADGDTCNLPCTHERQVAEKHASV